MGMLILRILIGFAIVATGVFMTMRSRMILEFFGYIDYMERKLGPGGSSLFYKLLGILFAFIGFMVATNLWDAFLAATVGSLFTFKR